MILIWTGIFPCAGLLGSFLKLQKAANLQGDSLID